MFRLCLFIKFAHLVSDLEISPAEEWIASWLAGIGEAARIWMEQLAVHGQGLPEIISSLTPKSGKRGGKVLNADTPKRTQSGWGGEASLCNQPGCDCREHHHFWASTLLCHIAGRPQLAHQVGINQGQQCQGRDKPAHLCHSTRQWHTGTGSKQLT